MCAQRALAANLQRKFAARLLQSCLGSDSRHRVGVPFWHSCRALRNCVHAMRARGEFATQICGTIASNRGLVLIPAILTFYKNLSTALHFSKIYAIINTSLMISMEETMKKLLEKIKNISKVKKIIIAAVALVLCVATVLSIILISNSVHPIEKFALKIAKKQNFQMDIVLSGIPIFGAVALTCEVDGNVQHIPDSTFVSEQYIETVGDKQYTYSKDSSGKWVKTENDVEDDNMLSNLQDNEMLRELINPENYEEVEGQKNVFHQKEGVEFENCKDVTIKIEKNTCTIKMILYLNSWALETVITISNIGKMDVTLPRVN